MYLFDINIEFSTYAREFKIPHSRDVFMRYTFPQYRYDVESDMVNLITSNQARNHCVCFHRKRSDRIYFESYGQITPVEIQRYLTTGIEFNRGKEVM